MSKAGDTKIMLLNCIAVVVKFEYAVQAFLLWCPGTLDKIAAVVFK